MNWHHTLVTTVNYCLNGKQDSTILSGFYFDYSHHLSLDELTLTSSNYNQLLSKWKQDSTILSGFYFDCSHYLILSLDELTLTSSNYNQLLS